MYFIILGKTLPFYGVQFHPEKTMFEWSEAVQIPHSSRSIRLSQYIANIFLDEVRKNTRHAFDSRTDERAHIISSESPVYMGYIINSHSPFAQIYVY